MAATCRYVPICQIMWPNHAGRESLWRAARARARRCSLGRFQPGKSPHQRDRALLHRRGGRPFDKGNLYRLLNNRVYLGEAIHKGVSHPGEHEAIVARALWERVHTIPAENAHTRANRTRAGTPAPLKGLLRCTACGPAMTLSHIRRRGRLYRYYVCSRSMKNGAEPCPVRSLSASEIEGVVLGQVRRLLQAPEVAARTVVACHELSDGNSDAAAREREVVEALERLGPVWEELFPAEQTRILRLLVERVDVAPDGTDVRLRIGGIHSLVSELVAEAAEETAPDAETLAAEGVVA